MKKLFILQCFLLLIFTCSYGECVTCDDAVGCWLFENTDSPTPDSSPNSNTGTLSNMTHATSDPPDSADGFDGTSVGYYTWNGSTSSINVGSDSSLDDLTNITYVAWIVAETSENNYGYIFEKSNSDSSGIRFRYYTDDGGSDPLKHALEIRIDGSADLRHYSSADLLDSTSWEHVAVTWDGDMTDATTAILYINGSGVTYRTTANGANRVSDASNDMILGQMTNGDRTVGGDMDEMAVFEDVLTSIEINDILSDGLASSSDSFNYIINCDFKLNTDFIITSS